jgi:hypothetical protein
MPALVNNAPPLEVFLQEVSNLSIGRRLKPSLINIGTYDKVVFEALDILFLHVVQELGCCFKWRFVNEIVVVTERRRPDGKKTDEEEE